MDVGGGDSRLVDHLLARGAACVAVLDISRAALERARHRLGGDASRVRWLVADVTGDWQVQPVDIWHDRAVFHFLTEAGDRARYLAHLRQAVPIGGHVIIATFALDGPERCSGLPVARYSAETLAAQLGSGFALLETLNERHLTPAGTTQSFCWTLFRRSAKPE
ncbi:MAG: class I SAM-dependent methyltransferase [Vicinamibacteraceae bacterium]